MLSAHSYPSFYARAVQDGAAGYVLKTAAMEEIVGEIRRAAIGPRVHTSRTLERARQATPPPTARELDIIMLVVEGLPNKEVAVRLGMSVKTIESRLRLLFDRYDIQKRTQLAALARREGWSHTPDR